MMVAHAAWVPMLAQVFIGQAEPTATATAAEVIVVRGARVNRRALATRRASARDVVDLSEEADFAIDMATVLRRTRGLVVRQSGGLGASTALSLNGLTGRQVPVFLDGLPISVSGFPANLGTVPVGLVERIDIHKGVVPVELGSDALGGALDLRTRTPSNARVFASYELASFGTHRLLAEAQLPLGGDAYVQAQTYYDLAENDYDIVVDGFDPVTGRVIEDGLVVSKNNAEFESFGASLEVGWRFVPWADRFSLTVFYNDGRRGLPHDPTQTVAYGEVDTGRRSFGGRVLFERTELLPNLDLSVGLGAAVNDTRLTDLAESTFGFDGEPIAPTRGEISTGGVEQDLSTVTSLARILLTYHLAEDQRLLLSLAPTFEIRTGQQVLPGDPPEVNVLPEPSRLAFVAGVAHRWAKPWFPIENDLFAKLYVLDARGEGILQGFATGDFSVSTIDFGVGDALVYKLNDVLSARVSGEWALRLPSFLELFGDVVQVSGNEDLVPERSVNLNLSGSITDWDVGFGRLNLTVWGFARITDQLILIEAGDRAVRYVNVDAATIYGVEGELGWASPEDIVRFSGAITYEEARNNSLEGELARFRDDRLPNRPYLYGSAKLDVGFNRVLAKDDRVGFTTNLRWVEAFFRFWPSAGREDTKAEIPTQLPLDVGIFYGLSIPWAADDARVRVSLESHNVLDEQMFDQLGVQRPGRSFHAKLSVAVGD